MSSLASSSAARAASVWPRAGVALAERRERLGQHVLRARPTRDFDRALQRRQRLVTAIEGAQRVAGDHEARADAAQQPVALGDVLGLAGGVERELVLAELVLRPALSLEGPDARDRLGSLDRERPVEMRDRAVGLVQDLQVDARDVHVEHGERRRVLQVRGGLARLRERLERPVGLAEVEVDDRLRVVQPEAREVVLEITQRLQAGECVFEGGRIIADLLEADGDGGLAGRDRARTCVLGLLGLDRVCLREGEQRVGQRLLCIDRAQDPRMLATHTRALRRRRTHSRERLELTSKCP